MLVDFLIGFGIPILIALIFLLHYIGSEATYAELLQDRRWREKRQRILERDKYKCVYCGNQYNLQVHHKYYSKYPNEKKVEPWNYPDNALITLCDNCHETLHRHKRIKVYYRCYYDNYK